MLSSQVETDKFLCELFSLESKSQQNPKILAEVLV